MTQIKHDPFARCSVHRYLRYTNYTCQWCGNSKITPRGRTYLYEYGVKNDDSNKLILDDTLFCSAKCRGLYYDAV